MKFIVLSAALLAVATALPTSLLPGGRHSIDVNSPQLVDALEHVQEDLNARLNSMYYHKIVKIIAAQSQVVAGVMYHVDFEFAQTQCLKSKVTKETRAQCTEVSHVQLCHAKILSQPWLHLVRTEEFHCSPKQTAEFYADVAGGRHQIDVHEAHLQEAILEAEAKINAQTSSLSFHKIIKVLTAEAQVVSGMLYFVKFELANTQCLKEKVLTKEGRAACDAYTNVQLCEATIHSQPWLKVLEVSNLKCSAKNQTTTSSVEQQPKEQVGGLQSVDVHSPRLLEALEHVTEDLNARFTSSPYYHRIGRVLSAQAQVVSGVLFHVQFEFSPTKCLKSEVTDKKKAAQCSAEVTGLEICNAKILTQPWIHYIHAEEFHCLAKPLSSAQFYSEVVVGGRTKLDVHDAHLIAMVDQAEVKINAQLNSPFYHKIVKITSAESQVVSGVMYFIDFEASATQCLKEKVQTKEDRALCVISASVQVCQVHILSQSWRNVLDVTSLKCTAKTL